MSDAEYYKFIDELVSKENEAIGKDTIPAPPHELVTNEYDFRLIHRWVTDDLIRQFADAVGDPNPLWRDPNYAAKTRWGGIIAPPTFDSCIANIVAGGEVRATGINFMAAGNRHEYFGLIRPGDEFRIVDKFLGITEKTDPKKPYRLFLQRSQRSYINQRNETVANATGSRFIVATPPSRMAEKGQNIYEDIKRHHFSKEELEVIHRAYDDELAGKNRRGPDILYWEDVAVGEQLKPVIKGPMDICDCCARTVVSTYTVAFATKWAAMREHLEHHPQDPETGEYHYRRDWHYEDKVARLMGMPYAFADGYQNEMAISHLITNWMGDDGLVKVVDVRNRRINILGDATWLKGKVTNKHISNGEHLVDLELWGENQDGKMHTSATATVKLLSRSEK